MKRIGLLVVLVAILLLMGVGALVARALESIDQEEAMRHGVVASRVFDEVERELTELIEREEDRSFLEYTYLYVPEGQLPGTTGLSLSPLAQAPAEGYVLGHFQIDPDGVLQLPWQPRPAEEQLLETNEWQLPETPDRSEEEAALRQLVAGLQEPMRLEWGLRVQQQDSGGDEGLEAGDAASWYDAPAPKTQAPVTRAFDTKTAAVIVEPESAAAPPPARVEDAPARTTAAVQSTADAHRESPLTAPVQPRAEEQAPATGPPEQERDREERSRAEEQQLARQTDAYKEVEVEEVAAASPRSGAQKKERASKRRPASEMDYLESLNLGGRGRAGRQSRSAPYSQGNTDVFRGDRGLAQEAEEDDALAEAAPSFEEDEDDRPEVWADEAGVTGQAQTSGRVDSNARPDTDSDDATGQPAIAGAADGYGAVQGEVAFEPLAGQANDYAPLDDSLPGGSPAEDSWIDDPEPAADASPDPAGLDEGEPAPELDPQRSQRDAVADLPTDETVVDEGRRQSVPEPTPAQAAGETDQRNREAEAVQAAVASTTTPVQPRRQAEPTVTGRSTSTRRTQPPRRPREPAKELAEPEPPVEVTVTPLTGLRLDAAHLVLHRDVRVGDDHYVQGLVLRLPELALHVHGEVVGGGELEPFVTLSWDGLPASTSSLSKVCDYSFDHAFEEPFTQLGASLTLNRLPTDTGDDPRSWVLRLALLLAVVLLLGFGALYRAVAVVVHFAERRNNFVAAVSHELKTPLTAIRMYGEILREGMVPGEDRKQEYYETITTESERLSRLIDNVLELSRLEKGTRSMALEAGNVAPIVEDVTRLLAAHAAEKGFELRAEIAEDLPSVRFDRDALLQVLINLTDNAIKFAHGSDDKVVVLQCLREGEGVVLRVRDHGPGVPAGQLRRIFQPFFRGERELTRNTKGTGIGLALVQGLIDQMGGRVTARNHPKGGFEVSIALA